VRRPLAVAALALIAVSCWVPPASAHVITRAQLRAAAARAADSIEKQTGASSTRVLRCRRSSDHRGRCGVESLYDSGASRCVTKVAIRLVGSQTRWRAGESVCY
jgi:hypothetical protein